MAIAACAISFKDQRDRSAGFRLRLRGSAGCALVPLAEGGATVRAPSLPQREAEEEAQGEEEDGTQDSQTGEVILQDADSAEKHHYCHHVIKTLDHILFSPAKRNHILIFHAFISAQLSWMQLPCFKGRPEPSCRRHRAFSVFSLDWYQTFHIGVFFFCHSVKTHVVKSGSRRSFYPKSQWSHDCARH